MELTPSQYVSLCLLPTGLVNPIMAGLSHGMPDTVEQTMMLCENDTHIPNWGHHKARQLKVLDMLIDVMSEEQFHDAVTLIGGKPILR